MVEIWKKMEYLEMALISPDLVAPILATILGAVLGYLSSLSSSKQGQMHERKMDRLWKQHAVHAKLAVAMEQIEYSSRFLSSQLQARDLAEFVQRATDEQHWLWIAWHDEFFFPWADRMQDLLTSNADHLYYDEQFPYDRVVLILGKYCLSVYTAKLFLRKWKETGRVTVGTLPEPPPQDIIKYVRHSRKCVQGLINKLQKAVKKVERQSVPFMVWEEMEKAEASSELHTPRKRLGSKLFQLYIALTFNSFCVFRDRLP